MATRKLGLRLELDGEKEFKEAMSHLNAGSRTLAAEMKLLQAEYKGNADSMEFLTAKGDLLQRQLDQQKAKTAEVRKMVEESAKALAAAAQAQADAADDDAEAQNAAAQAIADADKKLQEYTAQLYNSQAAEANFTYAIEQNNEAIEHNGEEFLGLGDTVDKLAEKFGVRIPKEAKEALNGIEGLSAGMVAKMAVAAAAVAAAVKVVKELGEMTLKVAADVDDLLTESAITGVSTEMLQAWDYAAPLIDVDAETIKGAMVKITKAMGDSSSKFAELGVNIRDATTGNLRSAEEVFYDVVDALGEIDNATERDIAANELLGKSYSDVTPLVLAGSDALKGYADDAKQVGYILSKDQIDALGAVDDAYQELQLTIDSVKRQVAADFAPAAQAAMEMFSKAIKKAGEWLEQSGLIENLASMLKSVISLLENIGKVVTSLPGLEGGLGTLNGVLKVTATILATIADTAGVVAGILTGDWEQVKTSLGRNVDKGQLSNLQQLKYSEGEYATSVWDESVGAWVGNGRNATGNDNWRGGLTWVGESGPELAYLPQGTQILSAQDSRGFGGDTYYITIDAASVKEFNDIIEIARSARVRGRMR